MTIDAHGLAQLFDGLLDADGPRTEVGPFGVWLAERPWPNPVRPIAGRSVTEADVVAVEQFIVECGLRPDYEWVVDEHPEFADVMLARGRDITYVPALALDAANFRPVEVPSGFELRHETPETSDFDIATSRVIGDLAFGSPGTLVGEVGVAERDAKVAALLAGSSLQPLLDYNRDGLDRDFYACAVVTDVAGAAGDVARAAARIGPFGAEIVGVGCLPTYRRRGLAAALTSALVEALLARAVAPIVVTAADDDVARIYQRLGFVRFAIAAEAPVLPPVPQPQAE